MVQSSQELASQALQFVRDRRSYLGVTDMAALLGKSERGRTRLDVYREKVGLAFYEESPDSKRGKMLEAIAAQEWSEKTGNDIERDPVELVHPRLSFFKGHLDYRVRPDRRPLEIKCPRSSRFHKLKGEGIPASHILQGQGYLLLDGASVIEWGIFSADDWMVIPFPMNVDKSIGRKLEDEADRFWHEHVLPKKPPAPETDTDQENMALDRIGGELQIRKDAAFIDAARLLKEATSLLDKDTELVGLARLKVLAAIESKIGKYQGGCLRLTYYKCKGKTSFDKQRLSEARPLDLPKVVTWLQKEFNVIDDAELVSNLIETCGLDISEFESRGEPYRALRPTFITEGE